MILTKLKHKLLNRFVPPNPVKPSIIYLQKYNVILETIKENKDNRMIFNLKNGLSLILREAPHSDRLVFEQVYVDKEYLPICEYFINNLISEESGQINIIDAGANVGYTSLFFNSVFPSAKIIAIEPDNQNFLILSENISLNQLENKIVPLKMALLEKADINLLTKTDFRDGKDWAITVEETNLQTDLKSTSISQILSQFKLNEIDILKIDIEGAERYLFEENSDLNYLNHVKSLIIEIHDEFNCRSQIYDQLKMKGFVIVNLGESTMALNTKYINILVKNNS